MKKRKTEKLKEVKYMITSGFGLHDLGEVIAAYIIANDSDSNNTVLLYHPMSTCKAIKTPSKSVWGCCDSSSVEFAKFDFKSKTYKPWKKDLFININKRDSAKFDKLITVKSNDPKRKTK